MLGREKMVQMQLSGDRPKDSCIRTPGGAAAATLGSFFGIHPCQRGLLAEIIERVIIHMYSR
jgi:hypothetical protein